MAPGTPELLRPPPRLQTSKTSSGALYYNQILKRTIQIVFSLAPTYLSRSDDAATLFLTVASVPCTTRGLPLIYESSRDGPLCEKTLKVSYTEKAGSPRG